MTDDYLYSKMIPPFGAEKITVYDEKGEAVWTGTMTMFGLMLAAFRQDLHREWRCEFENEKCTPEDPHTRNGKCGWIVWFYQEPVL